MLKELRKVSKHGSSHHISLPPRFMNYLRWRSGDFLCVEVIEGGKLLVYLPMTPEDLRAPASIARIGAPEPATR